MMIWTVFALMTGAAVMAVLWPLSRRPAADEDGPDAPFYREQMAEIERDLERGLLSPAEAEAARIEAGRRLLRAMPAGRAASHMVGGPAPRRPRGAARPCAAGGRPRRSRSRPSRSWRWRSTAPTAPRACPASRSARGP